MTIISLLNMYIHRSNNVTEYVGRTHLEINKLNVINQGTKKIRDDSNVYFSHSKCKYLPFVKVARRGLDIPVFGILLQLH